jgi:hypothetical protein
MASRPPFWGLESLHHAGEDRQLALLRGDPSGEAFYLTSAVRNVGWSFMCCTYSLS